MSYFLRQLQIVSSLKPGSESDKFKPFYKAIAPVLANHPAVQALHTQMLNKNLILKCQDGYSECDLKQPKRNLTIILSWMMAKGSHIDKYCNIYLQRGFDVLTVSIFPQQLLFPKSGSQIIAKNILEYVNKHTEYDKVLVHLFSVGAYLMGEVFTELNNNGKKYDIFPKKMAGVILDSAVDFEGLTTGFPRAISKNPLTVKVLEWYVSAHLSMFHNVATKHYLVSSQNFHNTPLKCPALFFVSKADAIGTPAQNQFVADNWTAKGVDVTMKCWEKSKHVSHIQLYHDEYISEIDKFIAKLLIKHH